MNRIILFFLFLVAVFVKGSAQVNADCINAIPLCSNPNFTFFATSGPGNTVDFTSGPAHNVSNPQTNPNPPNAGCLQSGELNPQWLLVTIGNAGLLEFVFGAANSPNPQVGCYDWSMWPYTPATCGQILNNQIAPIRCNWNAPCSGGTGVASAAHVAEVGGSPGNFQPPIPVNACDQFIICISNFSGVNTLVSFQSLGSASLICTPNCNPNYLICAGQTATVVPVNFAGLANPTYSMNPGGFTSATGSFVVSPAVTTTYVTYITGTNANNTIQTTTATSVVEVNPQPQTAPTLTQTTCTSTLSAFNLGLSFSPAGPAPGYTVSWQPGAPGGVTPQQTSYSGSITPGSYTAVITTSAGCSTSTVITINDPPAPSIFSLSPGGSSYTVTCFQPTVVLDATEPSYSYTWTNGIVAPKTGTQTSYNNFNLGNWTVIGQNSVGCTSVHTFTVYLNTTPPTSSLSPVTQSIGCGAGVVATATGIAISPTTNVTHNWYAPGLVTPQSSGGPISIYQPPIQGPITTSTFELCNNINGCCTSKTLEVISTGGVYPTFSLTSSQTFSIGCATRSLTNINIVNPQSGSGGVVSFTMLPPGYSGGLTYTTGPIATYTVNTPGTYTMIVKDNANNCETRFPVSIIQNTFAPNISSSAITRTLSCAVPSVVLNGISVNSPTTTIDYSWSFQNGPNPNVINNYSFVVNTQPPFTNSVINTYTLSITDQNNACKNSTVVPMWQNTRPPNPVITPSVSALTCATGSINMSNFSTTGILPNTFPIAFALVGELWEGPTPQLPKTNSSSYLAYVPGTYSMTVKDLNNGCSSKTTATVLDNRDYPVLQTTSVVALDCGSSTSGVKLPVTVVGLPAAAVSVTWYPPVPTPSVSGLNTLTLTTNGIGFYKVVVQTNSNSCVSSKSIKVENGSLTAQFTPDQSTGFAPLTVNFTNNSASTNSATGTQSITSVWSFGNGTTKTTTTNVTTQAIYTAPGTYSVTMFASKGSCLDTARQIIVVDIPSRLEVPNVFTPNGDGSNDVFFVRSANLTNITAQIFDRWGNKIYELNTDKGNIAWDGKNQQGKDVPDGTYFYTIKATGRDGQSYDTKGTVSIFR